MFVPERDIPAAVELARSADVAIVCVGNNPMCGGWSMGHATPSLPSEGMEALDRQSITLEQEALIKAVYAVNPNTVVVLISSFPYAIAWTQEYVPAILHMAHGSQELGNALADVLFGDVNPAGRLVQTWPHAIEQLPPMLDYDIRHGRTYMYLAGEPLYPFGHGLSYTTFAYTNLRLSADALDADEALTISVDVTNTGERPGDEVVQLYVKHLGSVVERPLQELKGFRRMSLQPGETQTVTLPLAARDLAYWNIAEQRFVIEHDTIQVRIGRSSADIQQETTVNVVSTRR
jgi:beta-glucosidase